MKNEQIQGFFNDVIRAERLPAVPLRFCRVGKAGACVVYNSLGRPLEVQIDMSHCKDPEYAILHEVAHVRLLHEKGYPGHDARFKKEENRLVDKYMYSSISMKYFA